MPQSVLGQPLPSTLRRRCLSIPRLYPGSSAGSVDASLRESYTKNKNAEEVERVREMDRTLLACANFRRHRVWAKRAAVLTDRFEKS